MSSNQRQVVLTVTLSPAQLSMELSEVANYIVDALGAWGGGGHPDSELFTGIQVDKVSLGGKTYEVETK